VKETSQLPCRLVVLVGYTHRVSFTAPIFSVITDGAVAKGKMLMPCWQNASEDSPIRSLVSTTVAEATIVEKASEVVMVASGSASHSPPALVQVASQESPE